MALIDDVTFGENGLVTAVVQDTDSKEVLMVAYMNAETLKETLESGRMVYWSRSRQKRWLKGETSGHFQDVVDVRIDCDGDALLFLVKQTGGACHKGYVSCFFRSRDTGRWNVTGKRIEE